MASPTRKHGPTAMAALTVSSYGCYVNPRAGAVRRAELRRHLCKELPLIPTNSPERLLGSVERTSQRTS